MPLYKVDIPGRTALQAGCGGRRVHGGPMRRAVQLRLQRRVHVQASVDDGVLGM